MKENIYLVSWKSLKALAFSFVLLFSSLTKPFRTSRIMMSLLFAFGVTFLASNSIFGQTCGIVLEEGTCPSDVTVCADSGDGAIVDWTPPNFDFTCDQGDYSFVMGFDLPESQSEDDCWAFSGVQRTGNTVNGDPGVLRLFQSTAPDGTYFLTPTFYLSGPTDGLISIYRKDGEAFTCKVSLIDSEGTVVDSLSFDVNTTQTANTVKGYSFLLDPILSGVYAFKFEFIEITSSISNKNIVTDLSIDANIYDTGCTGDVNYSETSNYNPGNYFPVGTTSVLYQAVYRSSTGNDTVRCAFDVIVNNVVVSGITSNASCGGANGSIALTISSATVGTVTLSDLEYSLDGGAYSPFGTGSVGSVVTTTAGETTTVTTTATSTLTGLSAGNHSIQVKNLITDCTSDSYDFTIGDTPDTEAPVVTAPSSVTVECTGDIPTEETTISGFLALSGAAASDNCTSQNDLVVTSSDGALPSCEGTMTRTYTITDEAGNYTNVDHVFTIDIPDFTPATDGGLTVNCLADAQVEPTPPAVDDYCGNPIIPVLKTTPDAIACEGDMAWVFTYTDCAGNSHDWTYTYTIDIPDFTPAEDDGSTVNCLTDAQVEPTPPAVNDYCGNAITPVLKTTPAAIACEGDMAWVFTYTDCAGNSHDWTYTYTIDIPDFTPAEDDGSTVNCLSDAQVEPTPPAVNDYCGNAITPVLKTTPAAIACEGDMAWVFTYTDCAGNSHDWTYTYTIDIPDFTPAEDDGSTVNCLSDAQVEPTPPAVNDYCGNAITPVLKTTPAAIACEGDMAWVFTYTDCAGNSHDWTYTYTIDIPDFTPAEDDGSTVNCLADAQVEPTPPAVNDYCGNAITPVLKTTPAAIACEGDMVWVFTYTDCAGNSHDWTYTYTIDIPDFTPAEDDGATVNCLADAQVEPTPPAVNDYCGNAITPVLKTTPAAIACEGDMVWVFTYTDCAGNSHDWTYTYTIDIPDFTPAEDDGATVNCLADAQVEPTPPAVNDYCGNAITPVLKTTPAAIACEGDMVWVFTYTDCAGNSHDWTYTYT
ncbi:hypothetical protein C8N47_1301, partial [Mangrovibacterium marinum]